MTLNLSNRLDRVPLTRSASCPCPEKTKKDPEPPVIYLTRITAPFHIVPRPSRILSRIKHPPHILVPRAAASVESHHELTPSQLSTLDFLAKLNIG